MTTPAKQVDQPPGRHYSERTTTLTVMTTPSKPVGRPPGRPYGSTNKVKGRKVLFGKQNKGQWHQGKLELEPDVSMVCLAAIDKETGHAERGVLPLPSPPLDTNLTRREGGRAHSRLLPSSPHPPHS